MHKNQLQEFKTFLNSELFFIVGLPKSGTTWVQHLLNHHDDIVCRGESHFFDILFPQIQRSFQNYNKEVLQQGGIIAHLKEYGGHVDSLHYKIDDTHLILLYCISIMFQKWKGPENNTIVLGEKTPDSILHLNLINSIFPLSKIIHVIRDGRDCVISDWYFYQSELENDKKLAQSFGDFAVNSLKQWKSKIEIAKNIGEGLGDRYCEVRYEELLEQPNIEVTKLANFLGVREDKRIISKCVSNASFEKMGDGHPQGNENNTAFVRKGISGDWRNYFGPELSHHVYGIVGDLLKSLGYPST